MAQSRESSSGRFGTFGGVFTPCTLTILGVIMFLRFGQVVGNAGVLATLGIVALSKAITTMTAFSVSAIATNTRVKGGGAYFMISRSLGVESGGSIGVVFFLAQAISVAMYVIGFTEAFTATFPAFAPHRESVASTINLLVFLCVFIGAGWTIKLQYGILAILLLSIASFAVGAIGSFDPSTLSENLGTGFLEGQSFFTMFALFFPAATGIMAGANMSGDLRDPAKSIPRGTLASIAFTGLVYAGMALLLGGSEPRITLQTDNMVVREVAAFGPLITAGIFAATLSSAIGSMMGAPRILQALARDRIFRRLNPFAQGSGATNEPRRAVVATFVIAELGILVGDLDLIAPIITMFFMVTYGYLNLATFQESYTRNPSYRPTFKWTHWTIALLGAVSCALVMLLIAPLWALAAVALMAMLHRYIGRRQIRSTWGDVRSGAAFERARKELQRLEEESYHPKNWRPSILAFSGGAGARVELAVFGHWLCAGRGILSLAQVITGDVENLVERRLAQEKALRRFIQEEGLEAFPAVVVSPDRNRGIEALAQCHGLGAFRPNTILVGWSSDPEQAEERLETLRTIRNLGYSILMLSTKNTEDSDPREVPDGTIDVWWRGKENGPLMVMLAHLLVQNEEWRDHKIRLLRVVSSESGVEESERHLRELLGTARIRAEAKAIVSEDPLGAIRETSRNAAIVMMGFRLPEHGENASYLTESTNHMLHKLGTVFLVHSAGNVALDA
ncbi:Amino acid permease [Planctomycetes bacterium Poly30]|uniref:Amino acid permease n=1 Tax=Saltatorellus ferox TaxID=2528018 RepID=A0A518EX40_9BACT|nr:Amino acid permease [Planctomycetes bacterium Poly30]